MVAGLNVRFQFASSKRPKKADKGPLGSSECLITVYATKAIKTGEELVAEYGSQFWG